MGPVNSAWDLLEKPLSIETGLKKIKKKKKNTNTDADKLNPNEYFNLVN